MAEPEIYSNPQRLLSLADELRIFNNDLRIEIEKMNEGLHHLGATWQDEEFKKFKQTLDNLKEEFAKLDQDISKHEPELKADAQALRDYLNKTIH
jgi:uncharacterized protein YukE